MKLYLRTITKGIIWEIIGVITAFLIFKEWKPIGIYFLIRILSYYPYHRLFKKIKFNNTLNIKWLKK